MNKLNQLFYPKYSFFTAFVLTLITLNAAAQSAQQRNWVDTKVTYTTSSKQSIIVTNSLPRGGGQVQHKGKEYHYFIFWTSILNESPSTVELDIKFPAINFFPSKESHFMVSFTKATMSLDKLQEFDYGLTDVPSLLNSESNRLTHLSNKVLSKKEFLFYTPVFIHKTKWPVRTAFIVKDNKLLFKIKAGADSVMVPCGAIKFIN